MENNSNALANEQQVGGTHYRAGKLQLQHWDYVAINRLPYFEAQITRYVTRWRKKEGVADVQKALHYHLKLSELYATGVLPWPQKNREAISLMEFAEANDLSPIEFQIFHVATTYMYAEDFGLLRDLLEQLLKAAQEEARVNVNAG